MEFRDVKPPMPTLLLPEDYVYNPLYFTAENNNGGAAARRASTTLAALSPPPQSQTTLPSSTYLHRPLHFVAASPHNTPQRRHSRVSPVKIGTPPSTPLSTSQLARRSSSGHAADSSLLRRAHALTAEVAAWHRFEATLDNAKRRHGGTVSGSDTDVDASGHRATRTSQLRAHRNYEAMGDKEEAENNIFYRPKGRPPSMSSLLSPRPFTGTTPASTPRSDFATPRRRNAGNAGTTPRSTKAAELRHRHSILLMEEMEELRRLKMEEAEKEVPAASSRHSSAHSRTSAGSAVRHSRRSANGHVRALENVSAAVGNGRVGSAVRSRRRSSLTSVGSRDDMKAAVSRYLDEQERLTEEQPPSAAAPPQHNRGSSERDFDAPAALPAPKLRKRGETTAQAAVPREKTITVAAAKNGKREAAEPPSPEPRPPRPAVPAAASVKHAPVPSSAASTATTALPVPAAVSARAEVKPASLTRAAGDAVSAPTPPATHTKAAEATPTVQPSTISGTAVTASVLPAAHHVDHGDASRVSSRSSSSSSYVSIEFHLATSTSARSSASPSACAADRCNANRDVAPPLEGPSRPQLNGAAAGVGSRGHPLTPDQDEVKSAPDAPLRTPSPTSSSSLPKSPSPSTRAPVQLKASAGSPVFVPPPALVPQVGKYASNAAAKPQQVEIVMEDVADTAGERKEECDSYRTRTVNGDEGEMEEAYRIPTPTHFTASHTTAMHATNQFALVEEPARNGKSKSGNVNSRLPRRGATNRADESAPVGSGCGGKGHNAQEQHSKAFEVIVPSAPVAALDETALSQSFASLHSFHSGDEALLTAEEHPVHTLPSAHRGSSTPTRRADDAATTQAELLRYYRSANASSVGPLRHATAPCAPASLPMRTTAGDDLGGVDTALEPHTAVEEIDAVADGDSVGAVLSRYASALRSATTSSASAQGSGDRSSVFTASTPTSGSKKGDGTVRSSSGGHDDGPHRAEGKSAAVVPPSVFLVSAADDFSELRGAVVAVAASGDGDTRRSSFVNEPYSGGGGFRAWGLPVPPTNHTHADAAWEARERAEASGDATPAKAFDVTALRVPSRRASKADLPPPYEPRMEGPVWKDALDTVRLPHLQESNKSTLPTPNASSASVGTALRRYEFPVSEMDLQPAAPRREPIGAAPSEEADVSASVASISSIPTSASRPSLEQSPSCGVQAARTSRLPARTHATPQASAAAHAELPQLAAHGRPSASAWTRQRPFTVGGAVGPREAATTMRQPDSPSVRLPRNVEPIAQDASGEFRSPVKAEKAEEEALEAAQGTSEDARGVKLKQEREAHPTEVVVNITEEDRSAAAELESSAQHNGTPSSPRLAAVEASRVSEVRVEEKGSRGGDGTPSASINSALSPTASDSGVKPSSKYAQWKAKDEARRRAATEQSALEQSAEKLHKADTPATALTAAPTAAPPLPPRSSCEKQDALLVVPAAAASLSPVGSSALASTLHTALMSQSVGGTEAERTPRERSTHGMHSPTPEEEMAEAEGAKGPLSHAPTPLPFRTPPLDGLNDPPEKPRSAGSTAGEPAAAAATSEPPSRAFSRSDASTRSLTNAAAEVQAATTSNADAEQDGGRATLVTPVQWLSGLDDGDSPAPRCAAAAAQSVGEVKAEEDAVAQEKATSTDSPPASADVTLVRDTSPLRSSEDDAVAVRLFPQAPATQTVDGGALTSPVRRPSLEGNDGVMALATSPALFSANSSSYGSTPALHSASLSASLARLDGGAAPAQTAPSSELRCAGDDNVSGGREAQTATECPREPVRQHALTRHGGVSGDGPAVSAPRRSSQGTATEDEVIPSPYRPHTPLPGNDFQPVQSLPNSSAPWSECASPDRVWADLSPSTTEPWVTEEGLDVFKAVTRSAPTAPLTRVQYYHVDL